MATGWVAKMRASMARLTPRFSANRVVREYTEKYYVPAAAAYGARAADHGRLGAELIAWRRALAAHWQEARFGAMSVATHGTEQRVTVTMRFGGLDPEAVRVELYADPVNDGESERHAIERVRKLDEFAHGYEYCVSIPAARALGDYTPRLRSPRSPSRRARSCGSGEPQGPPPRTPPGPASKGCRLPSGQHGSPRRRRGKVREGITSYDDPGWYKHPPGSVAETVSS